MSANNKGKFINYKTGKQIVPADPPKHVPVFSAELAIMPKTHVDNGITYLYIRQGVYRQVRSKGDLK